MSLMGVFASGATKTYRDAAKKAKAKKSQSEPVSDAKGRTVAENSTKTSTLGPERPMAAQEGAPLNAGLSTPRTPPKPEPTPLDMAKEEQKRLQGEQTQYDAMEAEGRARMDAALADPLPTLNQESIFQRRSQDQILRDGLLQAAAYQMGVRPEYIQRERDRRIAEHRAEAEERNKLNMLEVQQALDAREQREKRAQATINAAVSGQQKTDIRMGSNLQTIQRLQADVDRNTRETFKNNLKKDEVYLKYSPKAIYDQAIEMGLPEEEARQLGFAKWNKLRADERNIDSLINSRNVNADLRKMAIENQSKSIQARWGIAMRQIDAAWRRTSFVQGQMNQRQDKQLTAAERLYNLKLDADGQKGLAKLEALISQTKQKIAGYASEIKARATVRDTPDGMRAYNDKVSAKKNLEGQLKYMQEALTQIKLGRYTPEMGAHLAKLGIQFVSDQFGLDTDFIEDGFDSTGAPESNEYGLPPLNPFGGAP